MLTDSPDPKLQYLSDPVVTADHAFIRLHGCNPKFWYNYLYKKEELEPWVKKVNQIGKKAKKVRVYFNNHYTSKAVINAFQFKEMTGTLSDNERKRCSVLKNTCRAKSAWTSGRSELCRRGK